MPKAVPVLTLGFAAICAAAANSPNAIPQAAVSLGLARTSPTAPLILKYDVVADVPKPFDASNVSFFSASGC
jgi:hypothetical protein